MDLLNDIYKTLTAEGFSGEALALIDKYVNNIQNGYANFPRYTMPEHAGFCMAGAALVGASIEQALQQVAMLQIAKETAQATGK